MCKCKFRFLLSMLASMHHADTSGDRSPTLQGNWDTATLPTAMYTIPFRISISLRPSCKGAGEMDMFACCCRWGPSSHGSVGSPASSSKFESGSFNESKLGSPRTQSLEMVRSKSELRILQPSFAGKEALDSSSGASSLFEASARRVATMHRSVGIPNLDADATDGGKPLLFIRLYLEAIKNGNAK